MICDSSRKGSARHHGIQFEHAGNSLRQGRALTCQPNIIQVIYLIFRPENQVARVRDRTV